MKLARTKNTVRNTMWGMIYRIITLIGPFIVKTLIVNKLGIEYSGLSSLFTSILTVLNLSNLGFSSSIVFTMYKAIADEDLELQCAMIAFYRKVYKYVGLAILALGLMVMPFLPHLVKGDVPPDINLYTLFAIYLFETTLDYFMFAYTSAIFTAYQRNDVTLKISTVRYAVQYLIQCIVLVVFRNYYLYIICLPLMVIPNNIANYIASRKLYPEIEPRGELTEDVKKDIYNRVFTLFGHKVGNTVLVSIDSIIISSFLGLRIMGIYGNYYYILTAVNALVEIVTNGAISGIGNKLITDTQEDNRKLFNALSYGWIALIGLCASLMMNLYQPFIGGVWYSEEYLLSTGIVVLIVVYFYTWMARIMQLTYRDAAGLWTKDWLKPYVAMILNIVGSIVMVKATNSVAGVLVPTIFIFIFIYVPWEAQVLFKYLFGDGYVKYLITFAAYSALNLAVGIITYKLCELLSPSLSFVSCVARGCVTVIVFSAVWWILTHKMEEYRRLISYVTRFRRK